MSIASFLLYRTKINKCLKMEEYLGLGGKGKEETEGVELIKVK
jgi:hypothetical protein